MLTITNCNTNDALVTYSVVVTNFFGSATNGGLTLIVSNVPPGLLYAENFPYVGPSGGDLPITGVGWVGAAPASTASAFIRLAAAVSVMSIPIHRSPPPTLTTRRIPMTPAPQDCPLWI